MLDRYENHLSRLLDAEVQRERDGLASGAAADFADYRRRVGCIEGLLKAMEMMAFAHKDTFED